MKWLASALLIVVLMLQSRLWLSGDGVSELARLSGATSSSSPKSRTSRQAWRPSRSAHAASSA
jgi:hypothetical protein